MIKSSTLTVAAQVLRPHKPLPAYYGNEASHEQYLRRFFDSTAGDYDRIVKVLAFGSGRWYLHQALKRAQLPAGADLLDVGIGTGPVAREALALIGAQKRLVGVDPRSGMTAEAALPGVELICGRAEKLPRDNASIDFVSMGYALRRITAVRMAFSDFHHVLRPGGLPLVLEIAKPAGRVGPALLKTCMCTAVPTITALVARLRDTAELWRDYWDTIKSCIPPHVVLAALRAAGFENVQRHVELGLFSEHTALKPG